MSTVAALSWLMANVRVLSSSKHSFSLSTRHLIMPHEVKVLASVLHTWTYQTIIRRVQKKGVLRVASACRAVSKRIILGIANVIFIDLLIPKRKHVLDHDPEIVRVKVVTMKQERTLGPWQRRRGRDPLSESIDKVAYEESGTKTG